jgi:carboxypeptidase Taq
MARMSTDGINGDLGPLRDRMATICDLGPAASVLAWDRQTYVPEGGLRGSAQQLASPARVAHEMLISPETGELLERAGERESDAGALLRLARRQHDRAVRLPPRLVCRQ